MIAYSLVIEGSPIVFVGGAHFDLPLPYIAVQAIDPESMVDRVEKWPKQGGIAESGSYEIELYGEVAKRLFSYRLRDIEGATLVVTLPHDYTGVIECGDSIESLDLTSPIVYIGHETLRISDHDVEANTLTIAQRAYCSGEEWIPDALRYPPVALRHSVDDRIGMSYRPAITSVMTGFAGRNVTVYAHDVTLSGRASPPRSVVFRGLLPQTPKPAGRGAIVVEMVDQLARFDRDIGSSIARTSMKRGLIRVGEGADRIRITERIPAGAYRARRPQTPLVAGAFTLPTADVATHVDVWGTARGFAPARPRLGVLRVTAYAQEYLTGARESYSAIPIGYYDNGDDDIGFELANPLPGNAQSFEVESEQVDALTDIAIPPGVYTFAELFAYLNNKCNVSRGGTLSYCDLSFALDGATFYARTSGFNITPRAEVSLTQPRAVGWIPLFLDNDGIPYLANVPFDVSRLSANGDRRALAFWRVENAASRDVTPNAIGQAPAAVFGGGRWLLLSDVVGLTGGGTLRARRGDVDYLIPYETAEELTDGGGAVIGQAVRLTRGASANRALVLIETVEGTGDEARYQIEAYGYRSAAEGASTLYATMVSGFGAVGHPVDESDLPDAYGLRINPADVDRASLLNLPFPAALARFQYAIDDSQKARGYWQPLVQLSAHCLVIDYSGVKPRIVARPLGAFNLSVVRTVDRWTIGTDAQPLASPEQIGIYEFSMNWSESDRKFLTVIRYHDTQVADERGGDFGGKIALANKGIRAIDPGNSAALYKALRDRLGRERLVLRVYTAGPLIDGLGVGLSIAVARIEAYDGSGGTLALATGRVAQIVGVTRNPSDPRRGMLEVEIDGANRGGYAPVFEIAAVGADGITVADRFGAREWMREVFGDGARFLRHFRPGDGNALDVESEWSIDPDDATRLLGDSNDMEPGDRLYLIEVAPRRFAHYATHPAEGRARVSGEARPWIYS